ncbi:Nuclear factor_ erythroid 2like 1, partial [Caligus rogercresseyi]
LIHSGSHPTNVNGDINEHTQTDAAAAIAAAAAAAAPPISDFLHPASSQTSAFKRLSDEHWKATLSSLYGAPFPPIPLPFNHRRHLLLIHIFVPSYTQSYPWGDPRSGPLIPKAQALTEPILNPRWSLCSSLLQPRESSDPIHPPKRSTCFPPSHSERGLLPSPPLRMGGPGSSGLPTPPAMKRYKRERLILPSSCTLSKDQIIHMPIDQFNDYLARSNFSEEELSRLKDARRKGKNR